MKIKKILAFFSITDCFFNSWFIGWVSFKKPSLNLKKKNQTNKKPIVIGKKQLTSKNVSNNKI